VKEFGYRRVRHVHEALALTANDAGARYLGGGTNLVDL
jgi:xanthine dehydrogenase YagS FAD-binding subunit